MSQNEILHEIQQKIDLFVPQLIEFRCSEEKTEEQRQAIKLFYEEIRNDMLKLSDDKRMELVKKKLNFDAKFPIFIFYSIFQSEEFPSPAEIEEYLRDESILD